MRRKPALSPFHLEGQTSGRGYIGRAAMTFGNRMPGGLAIGAGPFGYTDSLNLRGGAGNVHALLLLGSALPAIGAIRPAVGKKYLQAVITLVIGALVSGWYARTDEVPNQVVAATPYVITPLVLALSAQRLRMPRADGLPYRKGQGS
jgi:simple sugar transport system permease protein